MKTLSIADEFGNAGLVYVFNVYVTAVICACSTAYLALLVGQGALQCGQKKNDEKHDPAGGRHLMRFHGEHAVYKFISKSVDGGSKSHDIGVTYVTLLMRHFRLFE